MKEYMRNMKRLALGLATCGLLFSSCTEELDDSNLYAFSNQTIQDYLSSTDNPELSSFKAVVDKAGLDKLLSTYGEYTCFVPTNAAMQLYIDSLYNDEKAAIPHNGLGEATLDGLLNSTKADSLCTDIAKLHVSSTPKMYTDMEDNTTFVTILGREVAVNIDAEGVLLGKCAHFVKDYENDIELENGVVHVIDGVLRYSNKGIVQEMEESGLYDIWVEALERTGLNDTLGVFERTTGIEWFDEDMDVIAPKECNVGFTLFAETDETLKRNGITTFEQLANYANSQYGNCASWYDYIGNAGKQVSTDADYTNPWNALNMFLRYHIVPYAVSSTYLASSYNELAELEVYEYYRPLLPYTLFKVSLAKRAYNAYINKSVENASLASMPANYSTDDEFHPVISEGIRIDNNPLEAGNGYVYSIGSMLVYNQDVPDKVLKERIRIDFTSLLDELMSNRLRGRYADEVKDVLGQSSRVASIRIPAGFCENMVVYSPDVTYVNYLTKDHANGNSGYDCWSDYQGDELYCKGAFDFAIKMPPVPKNGTYEVRFGYTMNGYRTIVQFYMGDNSQKVSMQALDIPLNQKQQFTDPSIGWSAAYNLSDKGAESDKALRNHGYMRGPWYFTHQKVGSGKDTETARDYTRNASDQCHIRRIITRQYMKQGEYWLRFKTALPENTNAEFELDYIEIVPTDVYNNPTYTEDIL